MLEHHCGADQDTCLRGVMAKDNRSPQISTAQEIPLAAQRVALYARVSTNNHGQDPELQLTELREYAHRRNWVITGEYVDTVSGSKDSRPQLNRLMAEAHQRKFDGIVVWKVDRFGRSLKHLVNALADLAAYGVAFVSLRDNLDLSTPSGRLMFQIIGAMSEFERALIQERICAGLHHARAKGKVQGRPRTAVDIDRVKTLRGDGMSWRRIARELGISVSVAFKAGAASVGANAPDGSGQATGC